MIPTLRQGAVRPLDATGCAVPLEVGCPTGWASVAPHSRAAKVQHQLPCILEDAENGMTAIAREWLHALAEELQALAPRTAWLGLVPRQHSTGGKTVLLGMTKRGNYYLRTLLIHGARAVLRVVDRKQDAWSRWLQGVKARRGVNCASVAQADKTARVAWALLARGEWRYESTSIDEPLLWT